MIILATKKKTIQLSLDIVILLIIDVDREEKFQQEHMWRINNYIRAILFD